VLPSSIALFTGVVLSSRQSAAAGFIEDRKVGGPDFDVKPMPLRGTRRLDDLIRLMPWAACKSSIKARSLNSGFFRDV
jgi:hypothetical protein